MTSIGWIDGHHPPAMIARACFASDDQRLEPCLSCRSAFPRRLAAHILGSARRPPGAPLAARCDHRRGMAVGQPAPMMARGASRPRAPPADCLGDKGRSQILGTPPSDLNAATRASCSAFGRGRRHCRPSHHTRDPPTSGPASAQRQASRCCLVVRSHLIRGGSAFVACGAS